MAGWSGNGGLISSRNGFGIFLNMATKYGLAIAAPFVKGTAGSTFETLRKNHNKDNLIHVASSLGWLVRETLGVDVFKACLNLVESSPGCGGGMERLARAYKLNRLGPYREGALNAAKITSEEFVAHMAKHGLNSYGEPLEDEEEAAAAAEALAASSQQQQLITQQQQQRKGDSELLSRDLPVMSLFDPDETSMAGGDDNGGTNGGDAARQEKVSATVVNDDHVRVGGVDDPNLAPHGVKDAGNVRAPAATDPLVVAAGVTVGRSADQSQDQARSQVPDPTAGNSKKKLCKSVWGDEICRDRGCGRAHPPRCRDPRCFPVRRVDCQHWHRMGGAGQQHPQQQGNGRSAGPGRAGHPQAQGQRPQTGQRRQQQQRHQQVQQERLQRGGRSQQQQQQQKRQLLQPNHNRGPTNHNHNGNRTNNTPDLQLLGRVAAMERRMGLAGMVQQQRPSYRDVVAGGVLSPSGGNGHRSSSSCNNNIGGAPSAPVRPDPAVLSSVVAAVMAVLSGQHF